MGKTKRRLNLTSLWETAKKMEQKGGKKYTWMCGCVYPYYHYPFCLGLLRAMLFAKFTFSGETKIAASVAGTGYDV
jgi:hypothetical protein